MKNYEPMIRWRQSSVGIMMAVFLAVVGLVEFNLLKFTFCIQLGCLVLLVSLGINLYILKVISPSKLGMSHEVADGLLITGLVLIFVGVFF
jgi:hypothetical protein